MPGQYTLQAKDDLSSVSRNALEGVNCESPDAVIVVVDATNLRRNLSIVNEVLQYNVPMVIALTMVDIAQKSGLTFDTKKLGEQLGCSVVSVNPRSGVGISELQTALDAVQNQNVEFPDVSSVLEVNSWADEIISSSVGGTLSIGTFTDRLDRLFGGMFRAYAPMQFSHLGVCVGCVFCA